MPAGSSLAGRVGAPSTPPTPEEIETGRKYGAMIAQELVRDIQAMGMPAIEAGPGASPQVGDGIIRGYIVSTEGGGAGGMVKRMVIGFGSGTAEMDTVVEGYVVTPQGLRKLGSGTLTSSGNKSRGLMRAQFRESMHVMVVRYKYSNSICFSGRRIDEDWERKCTFDKALDDANVATAARFRSALTRFADQIITGLFHKEH